MVATALRMDCSGRHGRQVPAQQHASQLVLAVGPPAAATGTSLAPPQVTLLQNQIFKGNEKMDQFKLLMNWNQEELEQWALAQRQKEEDNAALEKYKHKDAAKVWLEGEMEGGGFILIFLMILTRKIVGGSGGRFFCRFCKYSICR